MEKDEWIIIAMFEAVIILNLILVLLIIKKG